MSVTRKGGRSSISNEGEHGNSSLVQAHLLTILSSTNKLERKLHDDSMRRSLDYGWTAYITSSTDYQHSNRRLNFEGENKKNSRLQISPVPTLRASQCVRKSNSKSMSISCLDFPAPTQVTPLINTATVSAADEGTSTPSASQSTFEKGLPSIKPLMPKKSTEIKDTKVEVPLLGRFF